MSLDNVAYHPWSEIRTNALARAASDGERQSRWIEYPEVLNGSFLAQHLGVPAGEGVTANAAAHGVVLIGVEGIAQVRVDASTFELRARDILGIEPGESVSIDNLGESTCLICRFSVHPEATKFERKGESTSFLSYETSRRESSWSLLMADQWGFIRGSGPYVAPAGIRGHLARLPYGQCSPWHSAPRDLFFLCLTGEMEVRVGERQWRLQARDLIVIPEGAPYRYSNLALIETEFLSIGSSVATGAKSVYFSGNPGWPSVDRTKVIKTSIDPYADLDRPGR